MRFTQFFAGAALALAAGTAQAQALTCGPATLGTRSCQAETACTCDYTPGGSVTGKPPGYFWNCSILAAKCAGAPGLTLLNTPGAAPVGGGQGTAGLPSVRQLQSALKAQGFDPGPVDGKMGSRTRRAVEAWQSSVGAPATGTVTVEQWHRLRS